MSGTHTNVGFYGDIPIHYDRDEITDPFEFQEGEMEAVREHAKGELINVGAELPIFEYENKREVTAARQVLALRNNGRFSYSEPDLPEVFLDHIFTTPDPRSNMPDPDMQKYAKQEWARGGYYNFRTDADYSIPEIGIAPKQMVEIQSSMQRVKDSKKIFSTSLENFHTGGVGQYKKFGVHDYVAEDGRRVSLQDLEQRPYRNATINMSNDTSIGWRRGVDHEFKVSAYGAPAKLMSYADQNWKENRLGSKTDNVFTDVAGQLVTKSSAIMILDLMEMKNRKMKSSADADFAFDESKVNAIMRTQMLIDHDMTSLFGKSYTTHSASPHSLLPNEIDNPVFAKPTNIRLNNGAVVNPLIAESLLAINNRQQSQQDQLELRKKVEESAAKYGIYLADKPKTAKSQGDIMESKYNMQFNFERGTERKGPWTNGFLLPVEAKSIMNYTVVAPRRVEPESFKYRSQRPSQAVDPQGLRRETASQQRSTLGVEHSRGPIVMGKKLLRPSGSELTERGI